MKRRLIRFFSKENSIRGASMILIITLALSNILGLFRDRFLTKNVSTYYLDIYYAAFRIPDAIFNALILGAITSAFIPIFADFLAQKKEQEGYKMANMLINLAVTAMGILAIIFIIFMPYLAPLVAPGFDHFRLNEVVKYSRILMLLPIFFSASYIIGGILNTHKRFMAYSLAPLIYNLAIIAGAFFLAPKYGLPGVIWAVVAGSFLHFLIQFIPALMLGYRYRFVFSFRDASILRILRLMIPRSISMGAGQIMLIAFTSIASMLAAGSISAFNLANNIETMPVVVLGTSFATAIFPTLAQKISENNHEDFAFYLNRALRAIGYLLIPSAAIFILLRAQIIRLILGSGKFTWDDTRMTAMALGFFALSIVAQGIIPLLSRAFYALKNTRTPMYISIATVTISVIVAFPLAHVLSVAGLALAFSIGSFFNAFVLLYYLRKMYPHVLDANLLFSYIKTIIISLIMAVFIWGTMHLVASHVDMTRFVGVLEQTLIAVLVGVVVFFLLSALFRQEEMTWAFTRRINGEKSTK